MHNSKKIIFFKVENLENFQMVKLLSKSLEITANDAIQHIAHITYY